MPCVNYVVPCFYGGFRVARGNHYVRDCFVSLFLFWLRGLVVVWFVWAIVPGYCYECAFAWVMGCDTCDTSIIDGVRLDTHLVLDTVHIVLLVRALDVFVHLPNVDWVPVMYAVFVVHVL